MKLDILKTDGKASGKKIDLSDDIFGIEPNDHAIYLAVKAYNANQRQGTHKAKERAEVRGGGRKPWKQKGRGGARAGTIRSPLWIGGGTIFGPRPRNYRQDLPKNLKRLARKSALSYKVKEEQLSVIEDFQFDEPKTTKFIEILQALDLEGKKVLLLTNGYNRAIYLSGRNIPKVKIVEANKLTTYDILNNQALIIQESAVEEIESLFNKKEKEEAEAVS